jgi:hypothetical protein
MKRYDTLPEGLRGVYLRVMRSLGNQLTARGASGIWSAEELGFLAERVGRIPREGDLGIFSIAKSYRGVFERIAEDDFRSYVVSKRLLQTRVVGFDGVVASVDVLDLSGFDESEEVDDSVSGCDVDDGFEDVETVEDEEDEDEDGLDFEDVEEEEDNSLDFEDVEEEEDNSLDFEDVEEDEDEDGLDFEDVEEDEDEDSLDFEDVEEEEEDEDEDGDGLDFEDVEEDEDDLDFEDVEEDEDGDGLDFEDVEEDEDNGLDFEDVEEDEDEDNGLDFEDVEEDEDNSLDFEGDDVEDASRTVDTESRRAGASKDTRRRPAAQQTPTPGIHKDWSRIRGVEGNESMETVLSGVESLFSKLRGRRS